MYFFYTVHETVTVYVQFFIGKRMNSRHKIFIACEKSRYTVYDNSFASDCTALGSPKNNNLLDIGRKCQTIQNDFNSSSIRRLIASENAFRLTLAVRERAAGASLVTSLIRRDQICISVERGGSRFAV